MLLYGNDLPVPASAGDAKDSLKTIDSVMEVTDYTY